MAGAGWAWGRVRSRQEIDRPEPGGPLMVDLEEHDLELLRDHALRMDREEVRHSGAVENVPDMGVVMACCPRRGSNRATRGTG